MAVYYKFKSAKDYDTVLIEGQFISVANLKERIFESKHLGTGTDFDLMISNAQSNEEYVDDAAMIPKNTSVLIRRIPGRPRKPIVAHPEEVKIIEDKAEELQMQSNMLVGDSSASYTMKFQEESDWDEFGNDLYAIPDAVPSQPSNPVVNISSASKIDEEDKIKALIETPQLDWSRQGQDGFGGRGFGRGMGGRMTAGRGFGRGGYERKTPPVGYICFRCKVPGHFIQHCPTNGDSNYDVRRVKPPTGIPKSMLMATPNGSYALPGGAAAVLKPNEAAFEKEIEGIPSTRPVSDIPPELLCPLCKEVMKDAVLTSKCCFSSFCDKCIREYIISNSMCVCRATNILADDLLPNKTLRETISRILESTTSSTENVGSLVQLQDMESARHVPPKISSPAHSSASRDEPKQTTPVVQASDVKVGNVTAVDAASEGKVMVHSFERNNAKITDRRDEKPESMNTKEPISPESAPVQEEAQEKLLGTEQGKKKKKKKARVPGSAADMQWSGFQDHGAENYGGMPLGPAAYNPYCGGGMPMGFDGFMGPFGGGMPYMGYVPGPFDVPFSGMLPPDPFMGQGYMMPPPLPPRDLSELGFNNMNGNKAPPMSREEFEAMKANIKRKREFERLNGRDNSRDRGGVGREISSSSAEVKSRPKLMSKADRPDRHAVPSRYSPPPLPRPSARRTSSERDRKESAKRRSSERDKKEEDRASSEQQQQQQQQSESDRKHKASVFSRISFPESEKEIKKKTSSSSSSVAAANSHRSHHHIHHRDEVVRHKEGSITYGNSHQSSEDEEEDEDHHFKRRPSKREKGRDEGERPSRPSRERNHERAETKRRR